MSISNNDSHEPAELNLSDDFYDKVNKNILITGAGFSKDYGGLLANQFATELYNNTSLYENTKRLLREYNYEKVYTDIVDINEKESFQNAIVEIFRKMDKNSIGKIATRKLNWDKLHELFLHEDRFNFIFTTNQDLVIERYFLFHYQNKGIENIKLNFPYTSYKMTEVTKEQSKVYKNIAIQPLDKYAFEHFKQPLLLDRNHLPEIGKINYIKLHGSSNWINNNNKEIIISGLDKLKQMSESDILRTSYVFFDKILCVKNLNLVIIGYGFNDNWINEKIMGAVDKYQARLYTIYPMSIGEITKYLKDKKLYILSNSITKHFNYRLEEFLASKDFSELHRSLQNSQ